MTFNNSPLLAMSPLAASQNNTLHRHRETGESSSLVSAPQQEITNLTASNAPNFHQIPFQATPVQHGPTPLTFGFGFASSIGSPSTASAAGPSTMTSQQWGQSHMSPSHRHSPSSRSASAVSGKRSETKRRRDSEDDDSDDDMDGNSREKSASPMSYNRVYASKQALPKRMRAGIAVGMINLDDSRTAHSPRTGLHVETQSNSSASTSTGAATATDKMDLGKVLSTLDKPSLLTLFSRLMTTSTDPTLRDQILAHIPSPSLDSIESALDEIERNIRNACAQPGQMRAEFAWGRLRNPVGDFVATSLGFLPFFTDDAKDGGVLSSRQETPHLSTTFNFLQTLTLRTLRIIDLLAPTPSTMSTSLFSFDSNKTFPFGSEVNVSIKAYQELMPVDLLTSANPNTIATQLIPVLLTQWNRLQEKLCKGVNEEGKMFGSEMMRSWITSLEVLGWTKGHINQDQPVKAEERALRMVVDTIRGRLEQGVGWLIGLPASRSTSNYNHTAAWRSNMQPPNSNTPHRLALSGSGRPSTYMDEEEEL